MSAGDDPVAARRAVQRASDADHQGHRTRDGRRRDGAASPYLALAAEVTVGTIPAGMMRSGQRAWEPRAMWFAVGPSAAGVVLASVARRRPAGWVFGLMLAIGLLVVVAAGGIGGDRTPFRDRLSRWVTKRTHSVRPVLARRKSSELSSSTSVWTRERARRAESPSMTSKTYPQLCPQTVHNRVEKDPQARLSCPHSLWTAGFRRTSARH